jgi:hypothetical protein
MFLNKKHTKIKYCAKVSLESNYFFNDRIPEGMGSLSGNLWGIRTLSSLPFSSHALHYLQKRMK